MESAASAQDPVHITSSLPLEGHRFTGARAADDIPAGFMGARTADDMYRQLSESVSTVHYKFDESCHVIDKLKQEFQSLETDNRWLATDVKYLGNDFSCFDLHVCAKIDALKLRVSDLEKDKQNQRQEITDLNKRLDIAESAARDSAMRMDWLLTEWLSSPAPTTSAREPPVHHLATEATQMMQSLPTIQCKSNGCIFGKHPNGASWGFPDHCCLDCQNKNKTCYSERNHGPRCCGGTLAIGGITPSVV